MTLIEMVDATCIYWKIFPIQKYYRACCMTAIANFVPCYPCQRTETDLKIGYPKMKSAGTGTQLSNELHSLDLTH